MVEKWTEYPVRENNWNCAFGEKIGENERKDSAVSQVGASIDAYAMRITFFQLAQVYLFLCDEYYSLIPKSYD